MNALTTTFYQLLADNFAVRPDKTALVDGDSEYSYDDVGRRTAQLAARLLACGVRPGDRVIVHVRKGMAEAVAMFAVAQVGGVIVNVNTQWTLEQLDYVAQDCAASLMLVEPRTAQALASRAGQAPACRVLVIGPPKADSPFETVALEPAADHGHAVRRLASELAAILYTSGSTGKPKGVMLTHQNVVTGARAVARYLKLAEDDRLLSVLPYSFDYGLNQLTTMMLMGGTVVHQGVAMPAEVVRSLVDKKITGLAAVPPLWNQIVRLLERTRTAVPDLRRVTNSGGKIPSNVLELMPAVFPGVDIYLMYGLTEAFRSTFLAPSKFATKMGSMGQAIPEVEVHVIKHGVGVAKAGEEGELVHRGPLISLGYWGKPEATAAKIRPCPELAPLIGDEPVVYSGDIVRIDADGDLWFVGRNDAMIKTSGFRVSPEEIEEKISCSGMVSEVVAFSVPDDDLGEAVRIAVKPGQDFDRDLLAKYCRREMPHYMMPRVIHCWAESMPRTASGKLARPEVVVASRTASSDHTVIQSYPLA